MATKLELYGTPCVPVLDEHDNVTVEGHMSVAAEDEPLMVSRPFAVLTVDPELVSVAVPVAVQLPPIPAKVPPDVVTVSELAVAIKVVLPGNVTGVPLPHVTVKL